jgi:hypothetical protein
MKSLRNFIRQTLNEMYFGTAPPPYREPEGGWKFKSRRILIDMEGNEHAIPSYGEEPLKLVRRDSRPRGENYELSMGGFGGYSLESSQYYRTFDDEKGLRRFLTGKKMKVVDHH